MARVAAHNGVLAVCDPRPTARHVLYPRVLSHVAALPKNTGSDDGPMSRRFTEEPRRAIAHRDLSL
jgi:hypothetical protein